MSESTGNAEIAPEVATTPAPANRYIPAEKCVLSMVVATGLDRAIGERGTMPWYLPADLKHFKAQTYDSCVIMGRRTFESIGKPLPNRRNIVITSSKALAERNDIETVGSLKEAIALASDVAAAKEALKRDEVSDANVIVYDKIVILGGAAVFEEALEQIDILVLTEIRASFPHADTFFPDFKMLGIFRLASSEPKIAGSRAYFLCKAEQPSGFAQEIPELDSDAVVVDENGALIPEGEEHLGLSYRFLTYENINRMG